MSIKRFETLTAQEQLMRYDAWVALCSVDDEDCAPPIHTLDGLGIGGAFWEREMSDE